METFKLEIITPNGEIFHDNAVSVTLPGEEGEFGVDEQKVIVLVEGAVAIRGENESAIADALEEAKALVKSIEDAGQAIASVSAKLETAAQQLI